ncbi:MAG: hypothetical protein IKX30_14625 [Victivallales bacterium]|nr:hypothetical protein [Victivallales bacterium]
MRSSKKEAARTKSLGELGELFAIKALVDKKFDKIRNLNDVRVNQEYADIYCEKIIDNETKKFIISVKARNKYEKNGRVNTRYKLGTNAYEKAARAEKQYKAEAYWMAIQFEKDNYSIYWGSLKELNGAKAIPVNKCEAGEIGEIMFYKKRHYFDFDYFSNVKNEEHLEPLCKKGDSCL